MSRVGVHVTTSAQAGRSNNSVESGRYFLTGLTERGTAFKPTVIRSAAQFEATFGGRTTYNGALFDSIRTYFQEGGGEAVLVRVVGNAATDGSVVLYGDSGQSKEVIRLTATSAGAWSTQVKVTVAVVAKTAFADERLRVTITGPNGVQESFTQATTDGLIAEINRRSVFVTADKLGETADKPVAVSGVALSEGSDDRSSVNAATLATGLDYMTDDWGTGAVAVPGQTADVIGDALLAHAQKLNRVALMAMDEDTPVSEVEGAAATLANHDAADYGALLYPWVVVPDGSATRTVPPEGYAAAKRAVAHTTVGPWRTPAGDFSIASWTLGTAVDVSQTTNEALVDANVTGIVDGGGKTRLYGWWSLSTNAEHFEMLTARDTLNYLTVACKKALEEFVFETIDGRGILTGKVEAALVGVLDPIARGNGFYALRDGEGNEIDPGYRVVVDGTLNTPTTLSENKIAARVSVRLSPTANLIELEIVKVPFNTAL